MNSLRIDVVGTPVPQGSKTANSFGHGVRDTNAKKLRPWRAEVAATVAKTMEETGWTTLDEPVEVQIVFFHQRIAGHFGTGRNAGVRKPGAPYWKSTAPDIDKLTRAILDSLTTSAAIRDDARVARLVVEDRWADAATGAQITITPLNSVSALASTPSAGTDPTAVAAPPTLPPAGAVTVPEQEVLL